MLKNKLIAGAFFALALFVASSVSAAYMFPDKIDTLQEKKDMQTVLNMSGANLTVDGVVGPMTISALKTFQGSKGLVADGIAGPLTRAALEAESAGPGTGGYPAGCTSNTGFSSTTGLSCAASTQLPAGCTSTMGYSSTTGLKCDGSAGGTPGVLGTGEGSLGTPSEVSTTDSKLKEGKTTELLGFTTEVDGDVSVDRVDVYLDSATAGSQSNNADDYIKSASLLVNGTKVATVDVSDFDEDNYAKVDVVTGDSNEYRIRFSGLNQVFADGAKPKFVVAFEAISSIDGTDITETWGVELATDSIRYVDGKGFSDTVGSASVEESFTAETEDVGKLSINSSSNNPEITTIEVSDTAETKDVVVFKFNVEEENDVDVTIDDMTITMTTAAETDRTAVISSADLYKGSTLLGSESVTTLGVAAFTDMGLEIDAGDTEELTLKLTFADQSAYAEGTTVYATVTSIDQAEDANGNDEGDMGTPSGLGLVSKTHILRTTGISVNVKSAETEITVVDGSAASYPDTATFTWVFDVTAFGDKNVYINADIGDIVASSTASDVDTLYTIAVSTGAALTGASGTIVESDSDVTTITPDTGAYNAIYSGESMFKINKGTTGTFTLTVTGVNATDAKQVRATLDNIEWTTDYVETDVTYDSTAGVINSYTSNLGSDAATPYKAIN